MIDVWQILNAITFDNIAQKPSPEINKYLFGKLTWTHFDGCVCIRICFWVTNDVGQSPIRCVLVKTQLTNNHAPVIHVIPSTQVDYVPNTTQDILWNIIMIFLLYLLVVCRRRAAHLNSKFDWNSRPGSSRISWILHAQCYCQHIVSSLWT